MAHLGNKSNSYVWSMDNGTSGLFDKIPKSVFAAMAVSALTCGGDYLEKASFVICKEWCALYDNGIITQKPTSEARKLADMDDTR